MKLETRYRGDCLQVHVGESRLDASVAIEFKDQLREMMHDAVRRVEMDLSEVEFLDSSGLGALVAVLKLAGPERAFSLTGLTAPVMNVFKLTRMDMVFRIHAGVAGMAVGVENERTG